MRVINPPRKITLPSGQHSWEFDCDDGKTYGSTELALLIGLGSGHSLLQRLHRISWQSEHILAPPAPRGYCRDGRPAKNSGSAEWAALSGKDRSYNLRDIPDHGAWEKNVNPDTKRT